LVSNSFALSSKGDGHQYSEPPTGPYIGRSWRQLLNILGDRPSYTTGTCRFLEDHGSIYILLV
jgi:hypothetical protein